MPSSHKAQYFENLDTNDVEINVHRSAIASQNLGKPEKNFALDQLLNALQRKLEATVRRGGASPSPALDEAAQELRREIAMLKGIQRMADVGYKKPPLHSRFQKGCKPGPGRPKYDAVTRGLVRRLAANDHKLANKIVDDLVERSLKGDLKATKLVTEVLGKGK